jgi:CubicO group peptidase (beta-lactamase class C family)
MIASETLNKIDELCHEYENLDLLSGNVLIMQNQETIFENSYGYRDFSSMQINNLSYLYNVGTIGKDFTAIIILQLMESGDLSLDDKIGNYLTGFKDDRANAITIKQLLKHQSGLGDILVNPQFALKYDEKWELADLMDLIKRDSLIFTPGDSIAYSNAGYVVLGAIIEMITGKNYPDVLSENIFAQLNLKNTLETNQKKNLLWDYQHTTLPHCLSKPRKSI